ncbi:glycoside hydrolase family 10 protein [Candidatus Leptofilum sp.]|uniref:glycoside hydrolase family 10 protein n=1 Tax=Candidatus Leptofilum sp. TaxID=3241576 RepID=UPI003B5C1219
MKRAAILLSAFFILTLALQTGENVAAGEETAVYLPLILDSTNPPNPEPMTEFRGVWVSRFDWTSYGQPANPAKIDEIVQNVASAGFNVIFFQVRGIADAYYQSSLEPWADRVSGVYGQTPDPLWDPLATMIEKAHATGIQVHAYINVYPVWNGGSFCDTPPDDSVAPTPLYHQLLNEHGSTDDKPNGLQWTTSDDVYCGAYMRGTPASSFLNNHLIAVGKDLVTRYDIDGLHLDHIRYGGSSTSCDPVSEALYGTDCFSDDDYAQWQRDRVSSTVRRFYEEVVPLKEGLWLSAAVWPIHELDPAWNFPGSPQQGNLTYYQDSKAWLANEHIDSISPMIYPGSSYNDCDDEGNYEENPDPTSSDYWIRARWQTLVDDFQGDRNGRFIIPGIGAGYCSFAEIEARIQMARDAGTAGHSLFSYSGLLANDYFDDLANGPYVETAVVPTITWHP